MNDEQHTRQLIERLADTPARIERAVAGLSTGQLETAAQPGEWSPADVLRHMRASNDILAFRLYAIGARDDPPLPAYDERRWAEISGYGCANFGDLLATYKLLRSELVAMLDGLDAAGWQRTGLHETRGRMSLVEIARHMADHEEEHCNQIEAMVLKRPTRSP